MAEFRTEEEQIQAIKDWWKENGNTLLIAITVAVSVFFGWKAYQNSVVDSKTEASLMYEQLLGAATTQSNASESSGVGYLAGQLKDKFGDTEYGIYAALFLARDGVENNDLDAAISELEWAKSMTEDSRLHDIINGRLARIYSQQEKYTEALTLLEAKEPEFEGQFLEIKGDILLRQGDESGAIEAYSEAYALVTDNPQALPLLQVKLADLGVTPENI
ncbi:MAG: hypothetical protein C9356_16645 [Oleiphilus sp.]|nr:MAG: hypothetical protein C9356_16645 [Oleiphilus sp.]